MNGLRNSSHIHYAYSRIHLIGCEGYDASDLTVNFRIGSFHFYFYSFYVCRKSHRISKKANRDHSISTSDFVHS